MTPTPDQVAAALAEHVRKDMAALPGRHNTLRAGILVPLVWRGELECVLTERCAKLRHHGGEVSFPGGRPEPDDVDLAATAVRETHEEIGVADVRLLGELSSVPLYTSEFRLVPFVAALPDQPMRPAEGEVARLSLQGASNAEIAGRRGSSLRTVEKQVASCLRRLGVASRGELVALLEGGDG